MPSIYMNLPTKFGGNRPIVAHKICVPENCPISSHCSNCTSSHDFKIVTFSQPKLPLSWIDLVQIWHTNKVVCGLS